MSLTQTWQKEIDKLNTRECREIMDALHRLMNWEIFKHNYSPDLAQIEAMVFMRKWRLSSIEKRESK